MYILYNISKLTKIHLLLPPPEHHHMSAAVASQGQNGGSSTIAIDLHMWIEDQHI